MTINDIKAAISARAKSLNLPPVVPVKIKMCSPDEVVRVYEETAKETAPVAKSEPEMKPAATPKQEEKSAAATSEQEAKPVAVAPKKPTTRKTKTAATVVPIDGIEAIIAQNLKAGVDYALIPGCGRKPSLLKPGAERLAAYFGYTTHLEVLDRAELWKDNFVAYTVKVTVINKDGVVVSEGVGSCNSRESRYIKSPVYSVANTVLKMAKKRAFTDSILTGTGCSRFFSQDLEDLDIPAETRMEAKK